MNDIRQADFDEPIGHLALRNGRRLAISRADLGTFQLAQELQEQPGNLGLQLAALKRIVPEITDEELRGLSMAVVVAVVQRALTNIDEVQRALGESSGANLENSLPGSPPETPTPTSATESPPSTG